jgi:hypothetical protein
MVTYKFKLIDSKVPVVRGKNIIIDSNVGGTKNTYKIYQVRWLKIEWLGKTWRIKSKLFDKYIGIKTFWRPYQKVWRKRTMRVPAPYWGKGPLMNLWLALLNDYEDPSKVRLLGGENTAQHCIKIFGIEFLSQELNKNLKSNISFYQSKFERHE